MNKKFSASVIVYLCIMSLIGCKSKVSNVSDVIDKLKDEGIPISYKIVYTGETDPNGSKTHTYKEKGNFADSRIETNYSKDEPLSGSIEIFDSPEKVEERAKYLEDFSSLDSFGYEIISGEILIRLSSKYSDEEIKKIEEILDGRIYSNNEGQEEIKNSSESTFYNIEDDEKVKKLKEEEKNIKKQKENIKKEIESIIKDK